MTRRLAVVAATVLGLLGAAFVSSSPVRAEKVCQQRGPGGVCVVWVEVDSNSPGGPGSGGGVDIKCVWPRYGTVPCYYDGGWWSPKWECYLKLLEPQPPKGSGYPWYGKTTGSIYACELYRVIRSLPGLIWLPTAPQPPVDPAQMARMALTTLHIPTPTPGRYPRGRLSDGRPYTVVKAHTWYWSDPATFHPLTARATLGPVWVQVTVTPTALAFVPGDGSTGTSCAGPGTAWNHSYGPWAASPSGCQYTYRHAAGSVTVTYSIPWTVTWTSSLGVGGTLPGLTTTATSTFAVAEMQTVVSR